MLTFVWRLNVHDSGKHFLFSSESRRCYFFERADAHDIRSTTCRPHPWQHVLHFRANQFFQKTPPLPNPRLPHPRQSEEEALTAKIIHYFSLGVLQLPEGITLRAYLAQKLDCDPMRITKKFTGTNCLGKRVYHSCERTTATYEVAKKAMGELAELEERFRARLERNREKRSGILDIEVCVPLFFIDSTSYRNT